MLLNDELYSAVADAAGITQAELRSQVYKDALADLEQGIERGSSPAATTARVVARLRGIDARIAGHVSTASAPRN